MQEHVRSPPLQKVSLLCMLDAYFMQGPALARAVSVLNILKATHSRHSVAAERKHALNLLVFNSFSSFYSTKAYIFLYYSYNFFIKELRRYIKCEEPSQKEY